jgi:mannosyl-3-phosphoglycerate phosphatase
MPSIPSRKYRQPVSITQSGSRVVVFSGVDGVLRAPLTPAFTTAAAVLRDLAFDDTALVLCSGMTRAELEFIQQKLDITHPFICENGGAVMIPHGYFGFDVPDARRVAGCQAIEFGRAYADVVDLLHRTADRLRTEIVGFNDMSIEDVAKEWHLPLLQARLAKLREYEEPFRLVDPGPAARSRLFKALGAAGLHCRTGGRFERVGAHRDSGGAVKLLDSLYRRGRSDLINVGITRTAPDDHLFKLVDYTIMVADDDATEAAITVVDWAEAIVDRVKELRRKGSTGPVAKALEA